MPEASGSTTVLVSGYNEGIAGTEVEIRSEDVNHNFQSSAQTLEIVSSDTKDDGLASGTLTLASATALVAATGTATLLAVTAGDTVTINGLLYTAVAGVKSDNTEFSIDGTDTVDAADLADSVNNDVRAGTLDDVSATSSVGVVTLTQTVAGAAGNATTLAETGTTITISGATFTGGTDADTATVNGLVYTGVAGVKANDTQFSIDTGDTEAATDLADSIDDDIRVGTTVPGVDVTAVSSAAVVTIDATVAGPTGDSIDLAGTANITASGATLTDVGVGARTVLVEGLDANWASISETVPLNGTTVKLLTKSFLRINSLEVNTVGSELDNAGTITLQVGGAGAIVGIIEAGDSKNFGCNFTAPADRSVEIRSINYSVDLNTDDRIRVYSRDNLLATPIWILRQVIFANDANGQLKFNNAELEFGPRSDIKVTGLRITGADDDKVSVDLTLRLNRA